MKSVGTKVDLRNMHLSFLHDGLSISQARKFGGRRRLQVAYWGSVMAVVFCKKVTAVVENITFYKGNK